MNVRDHNGVKNLVKALGEGNIKSFSLAMEDLQDNELKAITLALKYNRSVTCCSIEGNFLKGMEGLCEALGENSIKDIRVNLREDFRTSQAVPWGNKLIYALEERGRDLRFVEFKSYDDYGFKHNPFVFSEKQAKGLKEKESTQVEKKLGNLVKVIEANENLIFVPSGFTALSPLAKVSKILYNIYRKRVKAGKE